MSEQQPYPQRKSPRLHGYDYTQEGAYFVTICTYGREHLFGDVVDGNMQLSEMGQLAHDLWMSISNHRTNVELDVFVVMPNHVHGIVLIFDQPQNHVGLRRASAVVSPVSTISRGAGSGTLGAIVGAYKSAVTRSINKTLGLRAPIVWQESFHDHIIRNEHSLNSIRQYVDTNPACWAEDRFYKDG